MVVGCCSWSTREIGWELGGCVEAMCFLVEIVDFRLLVLVEANGIV